MKNTIYKVLTNYLNVNKEDLTKGKLIFIKEEDIQCIAKEIEEKLLSSKR